VRAKRRLPKARSVLQLGLPGWLLARRTAQLERRNREADEVISKRGCDRVGVDDDFDYATNRDLFDNGSTMKGAGGSGDFPRRAKSWPYVKPGPRLPGAFYGARE